MITYVNTVLVSNSNGKLGFAGAADLTEAKKKDDLSGLYGKLVFMNCDPQVKKDKLYEFDDTCDTFKLGMIVPGFVSRANKATGKLEYFPKVKWSNEIKSRDIKAITNMLYQEDTPDIIDIDFGKVTSDIMTTLSEGGKRIVLRLTFKDLPTRFRNWTESYEIVTLDGDTDAAIATRLANAINSQTKRARVIAYADGSKVTLTAMDYDDDDSNDTINVAAKVRFNANIYFTNPDAAGFASRNKYSLIGNEPVIKKTPGVQYPASAKLVRDRESQAMGYEGILNRGACTWPIIKPAMVTDISNHYNAITLEFENMYRAADDIFRKTKQTVEIYATGDTTDVFTDKLKKIYDYATNTNHVIEIPKGDPSGNAGYRGD